MKVYIDSREQSRIESAKRYYEEQSITVEVVELPIGDYIFTDGTDSVVFEFKTIADFVASIQDGRVFNQTINMSEEFNHHFVLIYGDDHTRAKAIAMSRNYRQVTYFQYLSAIASINRYSTVIESYGLPIEEAYYRMMVQAKKCLQQKPIVKKFPKKHKNSAFNYLTYCIYGISAKKGQLIVDTYNLQSLTDLMQLTVDDLKQIDGIGEKTAQSIIEAIGNEN